ncbi:hypothetical protein, partial [Nocardioides sp.]|uniref:hypothetical protein n=1 Tax=Nocardioides sp. TaxID=35761 RepID=UPI002B26F370
VIPTVRPEEQPSRVPSGRPSADAAQPTTAPDLDDQAGSDNAGDAGLPWARVLLALAFLALLVLLAVAPHTLRSRQRSRRLGAGPESAWDELRATTVDLGQQWPEHRSPREVLVVLLTRLGRVGDSDERPARGPEQAPLAVKALARIVLALEQSRYGLGSAAPAGAFDADVEICRQALLAGAPQRTRRRATWLPRSVLRRDRTRPGSDDPQDAEDRSGALVDHV